MSTREQRQWALIESLREELRLARAAKPLNPHHEKRDQRTQREAFAPSSSHMATQFAWQPHWERRDPATQREASAPSSSDMATQLAWQPHRRDQETQCEVPTRLSSRPNDMKTLARALAGQARGERRRMISTSLLPRWRLLAVQNSRHQHILQWLQLKKQKILVKAALQLWKQSHRQRRRSSRQLSSAVLRHCAKQGVILLRRWTAASTFERRRRRIEAQVQTRCATVKMRRSLQLWAAATRCL